MGILFVLIFWAIALSFLAILSGLALRFGLRVYLRNRPYAAWLVRLSLILPFLCIAYAGVWFIAYASVSTLVLHHDPGIGDSWNTNIGNGYAIDMIDVTDQGVVHPTDGDSNGLNSPGGVQGVRRLQVSTPYLFGTQDLHGFDHLGYESNEEDIFFVIDTRDRKLTTFLHEPELRAYASGLGKSLNLQPIARVYDMFRFSWFDYCAFAVLLLVPLMSLVALLYRAHRLKRETASTA